MLSRIWILEVPISYMYINFFLKHAGELPVISCVNVESISFSTIINFDINLES